MWKKRYQAFDQMSCLVQRRYFECRYLLFVLKKFRDLQLTVEKEETAKVQSSING